MDILYKTTNATAASLTQPIIESEHVATTTLFLFSSHKLYKSIKTKYRASSDVKLLRFNTTEKVKTHISSLLQDAQRVVILCDYRTLMRNNFQLLEELKADTIFNQVPLFLMHTKSYAIDAQLLTAGGVNDYFNQLIPLAELLKKVDFWQQQKKNMQLPPSSDSAVTFKRFSLWNRLFDVVISSLILLFALPLLTIIAIAIKLDSKGPIIYKSRRVGTGYKGFDFFKFRSMYQDADERLQQLLALNQYDDTDGNNYFYKFKNDPRVTRVGRLLRKTSLDELPQLFNVLRGEMSLVGNRPLPQYEAAHLLRDNWAWRFLAPAGLTGLWQITKRGKNEMSTEERMALDVEYAQNHSFWYDLRILFKTFPAMMQEEDC